MDIGQLSPLSSVIVALGLASALVTIIAFLFKIDSWKFKFAVVTLILLGCYIGVRIFSSSNPQTPSKSGTQTAINARVTPTATPSPTPTPKVVTINQTMTCTNCTSGGLNYSLIVKEATIDPAKNQVILLVAVQNNTSDSFSLYINYLKLQDMQTADTYDGTGDAFSNFPITAYQTILFRITYQFLPVAGHIYSLSCNLSSEFNLTPITIKFL